MWRLSSLARRVAAMGLRFGLLQSSKGYEVVCLTLPGGIPLTLEVLLAFFEL